MSFASQGIQNALPTGLLMVVPGTRPDEPEAKGMWDACREGPGEDSAFPG